MASRRFCNLQPALELWARWHLGEGRPSGGRTLLAKLIDNKGALFASGSGPSGTPLDGVECAIESVVLAMALSDPLRADVLRLEFNAAWWLVAARRGIEGYDSRGVGQFEKAHALGISLRNYQRRLFEALETIEIKLRLRP
jgi:hypothetical protein